MPIDTETLVSLTADIVSAHVSNNEVATGDIASVIQRVYDALQSADAPAAEPVADKPERAVSVRASIKPDRLISMIDGKPYKVLRRHLTRHGHTPESYRAAYNLPADYPMVASDYAETRRTLAVKIGLGRKPSVAPEPAKPARKPRARKVAQPA